MKNMLSWTLTCFIYASTIFATETTESNDQIQIYEQNPRYWKYAGKPVVLIGGSVQDNLFQIPDIEEHLDLLRSVGGNYVRCTMSCRDAGNEWPYLKTGDVFDLDQWNEVFWNRFEHFLDLTKERDIIVQIEIWATYDFYSQYWANNPYNPLRNINYTTMESGLPHKMDLKSPQEQNNPFFRTIPGVDNNILVLKYQQRFVDRLLSITFKYPHVLYCIDNETNVTIKWSSYWAEYVKNRAAEYGREVFVTEMWLGITPSEMKNNYPEEYDFVEVSQNNGSKPGDIHWRNSLHYRRNYSQKRERPFNNVKIYGGEAAYAWAGDEQEGLEKFWLNILAGCASARFHRPDIGLGLSPIAQKHIRSMRMLLDRTEIFDCVPQPHDAIFRNREPNSAYAMLESGKKCIVYFPEGRTTEIDLVSLQGPLKADWLDTGESRWAKSESIKGGGTVSLVPPGKGHWIVLIETAEK